MDKESTGLITVYHIQPLEWFNSWYFTNENVTADWSFVEEDCYPGWNWEKSYRWLCHQMSDKKIKKSHLEDTPLIWAWYKWSKEKSKPDLRSSQMRSWAKKKKHVLLTLEVPMEYVLLSDYDDWHFVLNYWYLEHNERKNNLFEKKCKKHNVSFYKEKPLTNKSLDLEIQNSWNKIFNTQNKDCIQATMWELKKEWIKQVQIFGSNVVEAQK